MAYSRRRLLRAWHDYRKFFFSFFVWYGELSATPFTGMGLEGLKGGWRRKGGRANLKGLDGSMMYDIHPKAQTKIRIRRLSRIKSLVL